MGEITDKEKDNRMFCQVCESDADSTLEFSDTKYDYYKCNKCGLTWKHPHLDEDNMTQKGFLQDQITIIDTLIRNNREMCRRYPTNLALRLSYDSLNGHRKVLITSIEMIQSPVPFESIE